MTPPFDIFQTETSGGVRWLEAAATLEDAKARVEELAARSPGEYLLLNQKTGNKLVIKLNGIDRAPGDWSGISRRRRHTMSDGALKYPEWQTPLQELVLEFDREKLREKIQKVETLIFERLQQAAQGSEGRSEQEAMNDALSVLRIIKRDKLGFPDWKWTMALDQVSYSICPIENGRPDRYFTSAFL
jgi:hypothetical protein